MPRPKGRSYSVCENTNCGKKNRSRSMRYHQGKMICWHCYLKRTRNDCPMPKHQAIKETRIENLKRESKTKKKVPDTPLPKIRGAKIKKISRQFFFYLTREEKSVLYRKHKAEGHDTDKINEEIKLMCERMSVLGQSLRKQQKSEDDIDKRLKEELAKVISIEMEIPQIRQ